MLKFIVVILFFISCATAKPGLIGVPLAYHAAPAAVVAAAPAPFVTATSKQVVARNYNGIAHAPIVAASPVAKVVAPIATRLAAAPLAVAPRLAAPLSAAPVVPSPHLAAYSAPLLGRYAATAVPLVYSSPLTASYVSSPYAPHYAAPYTAAYTPFGSPLPYAAARYVL